MRALLFPLLVALTGCASSSSGASSSNASQHPRIHPIPEARRHLVANAELLGRKIHQKDQLAAEATDVMMAATKGKPDPRLRGWIVPDSQLPHVIFIGEAATGFIPLYEVTFNPRASFEKIEEGGSLPEDLALRFRARQLAMNAKLPMCSERYNTVVLPGATIGVDGWLVYLLAATTEPNRLIVGGHHLVHVSSDATRVVRTASFSRSCLEVPLVREGQRVLPLVTHIVSDTPAETHVFLSLVHKTPIIVGTELGIWQVKSGEIAYGGPHRKP